MASLVGQRRGPANPEAEPADELSDRLLPVDVLARIEVVGDEVDLLRDEERGYRALLHVRHERRLDDADETLKQFALLFRHPAFPSSGLVTFSGREATSLG